MAQIETMTFERKRVETITVTSENIKDPKMLSKVLEQKCDIVTKKSANRPWLYLKDSDTLKTIGGVRLNKNSIGTFYIDTNLKHSLSETMFGVVSKETKNFISNRIIVNDLQSLDKICNLINELMEAGKLYTGKRS
ncbi:hypothetical protein [Bacillus wiedmannii]|uniref:hypothetical protein n=1 Tax=Bacillus wiedmannii TaxID=1890302 RepID=UPI000BFE0FB6|nr:hypothetical protein [Bacillus wiedmannii]PHE70525.1 hypothetical protein COF77_25265 [Bacillus wiedmannii]